MANMWKVLAVIGGVLGAAASAVAIYQFFQSEQSSRNAPAEAAAFAEGRWCAVANTSQLVFDAHGDAMEMTVDNAANGGGADRATADLSVAGTIATLAFEDGRVLQVEQLSAGEISVGLPGQMGERWQRCG